MAVKRQFNKWLSLYGEVGYNHYSSYVFGNQSSGLFTLPGSSPLNPFQNTITIALPSATPNYRSTTDSQTIRVLAGAIVDLPFDWHAALDFNWNWNRFSQSPGAPSYDAATRVGTSNGSINLLQDTLQHPLNLTFLNSPSSGLITPPRSYTRSISLKLAGPLPLIRLWGGKPIATVLFERDKQRQGQYTSFFNDTQNSNVTFTPVRTQQTDSVYGEVRFPILGKDNHVPLVRELEFQTALRYDHYIGVGSNSFLTCFPTSGTYPAPLPASAYTTQCPASGTQPTFETTRNGSTNPTLALKWTVTQDIAFRGSYSTGYLPPYLNQIVPAAAGVSGTILAGKSAVNVTDPLRGNEAIGTPLFPGFNLVNATIGGNPNVSPQTSKSWSAGTVLTPRFVPGLRLSVDWTRITQNNVYFSPISLLNSGTTALGQSQFDDFIAAFPNRVTRSTDPTKLGAFTVGPIIAIDASTANLSYLRSESLDFAATYDRKVGSGYLNVQGSATYLIDLSSRLTPSSPLVVSAGVLDNNSALLIGASGGVRWRGVVSATYSTDKWSFGARVRYFGPYFLNINHSVSAVQGSATIPAQAYVDVYGSYKITKSMEVRAGVNDILDKSPPINLSSDILYSTYGDPRRANFYLSVNRKF